MPMGRRGRTHATPTNPTSRLSTRPSFSEIRLTRYSAPNRAGIHATFPFLPPSSSSGYPAFPASLITTIEARTTNYSGPILWRAQLASRVRATGASAASPSSCRTFIASSATFVHRLGLSRLRCSSGVLLSRRIRRRYSNPSPHRKCHSAGRLRVRLPFLPPSHWRDVRPRIGVPNMDRRG